ncbi:hypothetical protein HAX54_044510 [Datura stramonium]|uniref:Uncharacterized protein n=1 Tax=Datura stramonium TaxID=4076 RepID=A0ABS8WIG9_DATST|nr:hypothetical protein [Datura stramonium]
MWQIQRNALDKEKSKNSEDDDEQPIFEKGRSPREQSSTSNEDQEFSPENQQDMNSPKNSPNKGPGPSLVSNSDEEVFIEKGIMETSYNYLFKGDLPIEKGTSSNILTHGDQLIVQSLTQMVMEDEHPPSSERTMSRSPFPAKNLQC